MCKLLYQWLDFNVYSLFNHWGKAGRNRCKGKENEYEKRDLVFKEDGQGKNSLAIYTFYNNVNFRV